MTMALKQVMDQEISTKMDTMVESIKQLIAQGQQQQQTQQPGGAAGKRAREAEEDEEGEPHQDRIKDKQIFDDKFLKKVKAFGGDQASWKQWIFKFRNQIKMKNKVIWGILNETELMKEKWSEEDLNIKDPNHFQWNTELYDVLCEVMEGNTLTQVQNISGDDGIEAYRKLCRFYNPTSPAKLLKKLCEIVKPPKCERDEEITTMLENWKRKCNEAAKDFGTDYQLNEKLQIAIATGMMPNTIQELIYQHAEGFKDFKEFEEKMLTLVSNKLEIEPVPMDIGRLEEEWYKYYGFDTNQQDAETNEQELGWVSVASGQCFNCGGHGHVKSNCPSPPQRKR